MKDDTKTKQKSGEQYNKNENENKISNAERNNTGMEK